MAEGICDCRNAGILPASLSKSPVRTPALQHGGVKPPLHRPWMLPAHGLAVFHGEGDVARLSHYFLPRLLLEGKRVLFLDGANSADPRLLARLARERGVPFEQFSRQIQIARAFTCFQLTELVARVPRFLEDFPAEVLIVTAFPDLYFDEDVRDWDARVAFEQALANLRRWAGESRAEGRPLTPTPLPKGVCVKTSAVAAMSPAPSRFINSFGGETPPRQRENPTFHTHSKEERSRDPFLILHPLPPGEGVRRGGRVRDQSTAGLPLAVAVFSAAATFTPSPFRRSFFPKTCAAAREVWEFRLGEGQRLELLLQTTCARPWLAGRGAPLGCPRPKGRTERP